VRVGSTDGMQSKGYWKVAVGRLNPVDLIGRLMDLDICR